MRNVQPARDQFLDPLASALPMYYLVDGLRPDAQMPGDVRLSLTPFAQLIVDINGIKLYFGHLLYSDQVVLVSSFWILSYTMKPVKHYF